MAAQDGRSPGRRLTGTRLLVVLLIAAAALVLPSAGAEARTTVRVTQTSSGFQSRLVVTISSTRRLAARDRARSALLRYRRKSYRLRRAARAPREAGAAVTDTWQTALHNRFNGFVGRTVAVAVRAAGGTRVYRRRVGRPRPTFAPPGRDLHGAEAIARVKRYLANSRFTDCPNEWPACSTEHRYAHCAGGDTTGSWRFTTFPPALSPSSGTYRILDANQAANGSWGVTYQVTLDSGAMPVYSWVVRADGLAMGIYALGEDTAYYTDYRWQQPAGC